MEDNVGCDYDVFLSHSHDDRDVVEEMAVWLEDEGLRVWLDKWVLVPGEPWIQPIQKGIETTRTCAICVGAKTPGGWFAEEINAALNRQATVKSFRVIPAILPGGDPAMLDVFSSLRTWVDFRPGASDTSARELLLCGIRGTAPPKRTPSASSRGILHGAVRQRLQDIKDLHEAGLIADVVAFEFQRQMVDKLLSEPAHVL